MAGNSGSLFAVVTGGSSGIGLELARQFAEHGFDVLICSKGEGVAAAAETLRSSGASVTPLQADLATYEGVEDLVAAIAGTGRPVDAVALRTVASDLLPANQTFPTGDSNRSGGTR